MCGICQHPGPQHAVTLGAGRALPRPGKSAPLCVVQCERCRQEVRAQRDAGQPAL